MEKNPARSTLCPVTALNVDLTHVQTTRHELQDRVAAVVDQLDNVQSQSLTETGQEVESDHDEGRVGFLVPIRVLSPGLEHLQLLVDDLQASFKDAWGIRSERGPSSDGNRRQAL